VKAHVKRRVRYLVLEALYESETSDHEAEAAFRRRLVDVAEEDAEVGGEASAQFGLRLLRGVQERQESADELIGDAAPKYAVNTLAVVDRNILRLAIWELLAEASAPVAAVVNEAVELAHRYGGESSPAFVNGVLRTISKRIRAGEPEAIPADGDDDPVQPETEVNDQEN
jgi:transcription antitermination protein NusB